MRLAGASTSTTATRAGLVSAARWHDLAAPRPGRGQQGRARSPPPAVLTVRSLGGRRLARDPTPTTPQPIKITDLHTSCVQAPRFRRDASG